jgi:hypothetical protein
MASVTGDAERLERLLFKRGLGALQADRSRCCDCGRTPLAGEHVHLYGTRAQDTTRLVCELCRQLRREAPLASEIVRHCEHGQTVRITRAA